MLATLLKRLAAKGGFMTAADVAELAKADRLRQCLVRCNCGRFVCAAQDVKHYVDLVATSKEDYVRDVALLAGDPAFEGHYERVTRDSTSILDTTGRHGFPKHCEVPYRGHKAQGPPEGDYGGAFDGFSVTSDADPGL
jgi:hypothetical protein